MHLICATLQLNAQDDVYIVARCLSLGLGIHLHPYCICIDSPEASLLDIAISTAKSSCSDTLFVGHLRRHVGQFKKLFKMHYTNVTHVCIYPNC